jgi:hypothetical protein
MARIIGIAAETGENLRAGIVLPEKSTGGRVEREKRRSRNRSEDMRIVASLNPTKVLNSELGIGGRIKPDDDGAKMEVNESDTAVAICNGEEKVRGGGFGGE